MTINIPLTIKHLLNRDIEGFVHAYHEMADISGLQPELAALFTTKLSNIYLERYPLLYDITGKTSLHYAVSGDQNPDDCACFDSLITKYDNFGMTALMLAAKFHYSNWLEYLVEDEHSQLDCYGRSALVYAISSQIPCNDTLRFQQISFLFGYEWAYLDGSGRTCVDYARDYLPQDMAYALEDAFLRNCWAFGAPKGVKVPYASNLQLSTSQPVENSRMYSIFEEVQRLRKELLLQKNGGHKENIERLSEQIQDLLNENEKLKADMEGQYLRVVYLKQRADQAQREKEAVLQEMRESYQKIVEEREHLLAQYNKVNATLNESAELKSRLLEKEAKIGTLYKDNSYLQENVQRVSIENQRRSEQMMQLNNTIYIESPPPRRASESFYKSDAMVQLNLSPVRPLMDQMQRSDFRQAVQQTAAQRRRMAMYDRIKDSLDRIGVVGV